jgi:hypothetical protein
MFHLFHAYVAIVSFESCKVNRRCGGNLIKPLVVQLLWLPAVVKMETTNTRAIGTGCRGRSARMWSGMGAGAAHRAGWDAGLHVACVGHRHGKLHPDKRCLRSEDGRRSRRVSIVGTGAGAVSGWMPRPDLRALVPPFHNQMKCTTAWNT